ncbi:NADH-cytochrome b5 reductase 2 [Cucumispora dikerogammari]|nr:NADH-cytochrome b5 reductase 2 [Cucumispora dikerogammari]
MAIYKKSEVKEISFISYNIIQLIITNPFPINEFTVSSFNFIQLTISDDNNINVNENEIITRPYTPIKVTINELEFRIKIYKFGSLTQHLSKLKSNDLIEISQPIHKLKFNLNQFQNIYLIAGGTGITPMFQILQYVCQSNNYIINECKYTLFFCNNLTEDVFLIKELHKIKKILKEKFKIVLVVSKLDSDIKNEGFKGFECLEKGLISRNILEKYLVTVGNKNFVYVSGPPGFMECVCGDKTEKKEQGEVLGILKEMGFGSNSVYKF